MSFSLSGLPPLPKSLSGLLNIGGDSPGLSSPQAQPSPLPPLPRSLPPSSPSSSLYANVTPANSVPGARSRSRDSVDYSGSFDGGGGSRRMSAVSQHGRSSVGLGETARNQSPHGGRKATNLDTQLAFLRKEMVSLRQIDMTLLCQLWALNETIQEFKTQQSRHSSLSPHGWLDHEEEQEQDSEGSDDDDYYSPQYGAGDTGSDQYGEENYSQPYRSAQDDAILTPYRNGHGSSNSRLRPVPEHERQYRTGSNSSVEYGDI